MRGDQKWPPEEYKRQSEVDNEERRKLAQQPAFRPRRQQKVRAGREGGQRVGHSFRVPGEC